MTTFELSMGTWAKPRKKYIRKEGKLEKKTEGNQEKGEKEKSLW